MTEDSCRGPQYHDHLILKVTCAINNSNKSVLQHRQSGDVFRTRLINAPEQSWVSELADGVCRSHGSCWVSMTETLELKLLLLLLLLLPLLQATESQNPENPFPSCSTGTFCPLRAKKTPRPCGIPLLTQIRIVYTRWDGRHHFNHTSSPTSILTRNAFRRPSVTKNQMKAHRIRGSYIRPWLMLPLSRYYCFFHSPFPKWEPRQIFSFLLFWGKKNIQKHGAYPYLLILSTKFFLLFLLLGFPHILALFNLTPTLSTKPQEKRFFKGSLYIYWIFFSLLKWFVNSFWQANTSRVLHGHQHI